MYHATLYFGIGFTNEFMDWKIACNFAEDFLLQKYGKAQTFLQGDIPLCIHYSLLNMTLTDPPSMAMSLGGCFWASILCKEAAGRCYKAPRHRMATYFIEWAAKLWRGWGYCSFLMTSVKNASTSCRQIIHAAAAEPDDFFEYHELWLLPFFGEHVL